MAWSWLRAKQYLLQPTASCKVPVLPPCVIGLRHCLCKRVLCLPPSPVFCSVVACADATARQVMANLPYDQMHAPVLGPAHPYQKDGVAAGMRNHRAGHVEVSTDISHLQSMQPYSAKPHTGYSCCA